MKAVREHFEICTEKSFTQISSGFFANTDVFTVGEYLSPGWFFLAHLEVFSYIALCKIIKITRWHTHCGSIPFGLTKQKGGIENEKKEGNSYSGASIQ